MTSNSTLARESVLIAKEKKLLGVKGVIDRAQRFGIWISFTVEGKPNTAGFFPGRAYANGSRLLLDVCRSDQELSLLFPKGMEVTFDCHSNGSGSSYPDEMVGGDKTSKDGGSGKGNKRCGYMITLLWVGQRPAESDLKSTEPLAENEKHFQARLDWIEKSVLSVLSPPAPSLPLASGESWFVKSLLLPSGQYGLPHPDEAVVQGAEGVVAELHRPDGGVVIADGGRRVYIHRSRVFLDDELHLSATLDLSKFLVVNSRVKIDYIPNDGYFGGDSPAEFVALLLYTGKRPQVPRIIFDNPLKGAGGKEKYFIAKIVSFDPPDETGVAGGIAEILRPSDKTTLSFYAKNSFKKFININPEVNLVRFHRSRMFHLGMLLHKADLRYFFSAAYSLDTFCCYVQPMSGVASDAEVNHEVAVGWKSTTGSLRMLPYSHAEDTLLYPRIFSYQNLKFCAAEQFDAETYENLVEGLLPPRSQFFNGTENVGPDFVLARIHDLFQPTHNKTAVTAGIMRIESGQHENQLAFFDRNVTSAFGFKLCKADLQHLLDQNEPVFVKLQPVEGKDVLVKLKAVEVWLGWPHCASQTLDNIPSTERHKLLLFLETKNMTVSDFLKAVEGKCPARQFFIQLPKEENQGRVIQLERMQSKCKVAKKNHFPGAVGGIIKVDRGPLAGKLVTFNRKNTWVMGHNLCKADLTHIFIEGQKVNLEAFQVPQEDKNKTNDPAGQVMYRATLVWTSKFRPRNRNDGVTKTVKESPHVNNWLKKRHLDWNRFQLLVEGKLPMVDPELACRNSCNMLKGTNSKDTAIVAETVSSVVAKKKDKTTEVFRHGSEASRICDMALTVTGPNDSTIRHIIKSDDNAQMAFHIVQTLQQALTSYQQVRQSPWAKDFTDTPVWASQSSSSRNDLFGFPAPVAPMHMSPWAGNAAMQQQQQAISASSALTMYNSSQGPAKRKAGSGTFSDHHHQRGKRFKNKRKF